MGLKLSGHTDTLTAAINLIDDLYKRGDFQNEKQYRNALDKIHTQKLGLPSKILKQKAFLRDLKLKSIC